MSETGNNKTYTHTSADNKTQINLTKYNDKNGKENYVTQFKQDGKEVFHITTHPDSTYYTDKDGKTKIK